jgi:hypothetical protein
MKHGVDQNGECVCGHRVICEDEVIEVVQEALGDVRLADWFWDLLSEAIKRRSA